MRLYSLVDSARLERSQKLAKEWLNRDMGKPPQECKYLISAEATGSDGTPISIDVFYYSYPDNSGRIFVGPTAWSFGFDGVLGEISTELLATAYIGWLWVFPLAKSGELQDKIPDRREYAAFEGEAVAHGCENIKLLRCKKAGEFEYYVAEARREGVDCLIAGALNEVQIVPKSKPICRIPIEYVLIGTLLDGSG